MIIDIFENRLFDLIEEFSGMELTKAEAIGVLEIAKQRIIKEGLDNEQ